jgi:WD40 repeat protein
MGRSIGLSLLTAAIPLPAPAATVVRFSQDIAPTLQGKCVTCHGPDKQKGGYRIDSFEWLQKSGESGNPPVVAGTPDQSELFKRITAADPDDRMPQKSDPLPPEFVDALKAWIAAGAPFDGSNPKQALVDLLPPAAHRAPPETYPHPIPVLSLAPAGNGRLAIGGYHEILLRSADTGELLQRLTNLPERIHALLPSADGHALFYAGGNPGRSGEAGIIDLQATGTHALPRVLARSTDSFLCLAVSPDGKALSVGGADKLIGLIEVATGRVLRQITQHSDWVMGLAFNADGSRLASASRDGTSRVFDPATGEMVCAFREHEGPVFDVVFLGDGSQAASAGRDGHVRFWNAHKGDQTADVGGLGGEVYKLAVADGTLLCALSDGSVREVSLADRTLRKKWSSPAPGGDLTIAVNHDSHGFVSGRESGLVECWKLDGGEPVLSFTAWPMASSR